MIRPDSLAQYLPVEVRAGWTTAEDMTLGSKAGAAETEEYET